MIKASTAKSITNEVTMHNRSEYYSKVLVALEHINDFVVTSANDGYCSIKLIDASVEPSRDLCSESIERIANLYSYRDSLVEILIELGYSVDIDGDVVSISWGNYA